MSKGVLGPSIVTLCLGSISGFHLYKTIGRSQYLDANKNVSELLENEKFQLLSSDKDSIWEKIINAYKNEKIKDEERFESAGKDDPELKEKIKAECQKITGKPTQSLSTYNKARRWCVVPQTTTQRLKLEGRTSLQKNDNVELWKGIAERYQEKGIKTFEIGENKEVDAIVKTIQEKCPPLLEAYNWDKDFDSTFEKTKRYCSVKEQETA